jgi:UDPglucose 6-dehydrogenase
MMRLNIERELGLMKVTIFCIVYVGLVQGAVLIEAGRNVTRIDVDECRIVNLKIGIIPIFEHRLTDIVTKCHNDGRSHFTADAKSGMAGSEVVHSAGITYYGIGR